MSDQPEITKVPQQQGSQLNKEPLDKKLQKPKEKSDYSQKEICKSAFQQICYAVIAILIAYNLSQAYNNYSHYFYKNKVKFNNDYTVAFENFRPHIQNYVLGDEGLKSVASQLAGQKSTLKEIDLNLGECEISNVGLQGLAASLESLENVQKVKLLLGHNSFGIAGVEYLVDSLKKMKSLHNLHIGLDTLNKTYSYKIGEYLGYQLPMFKQLDRLYLSLISNNLTDKGVELIANGLGQMTNLKTLGLVLIDNNIGKNGANYLAQMLDKLTHLKELTLSLYSNKIEAEGCYYLAKPLKRFKALDSLTLSLYFNNVTQTGAQNLGESLRELVQLKQLQLDLSFNYILNEGAFELAQSLQNLTNLKRLSLNFDSKNFGPSGFSAISVGVAKLTQLEELELMVAINKIGISGILDLKMLLGSLVNLRRLKLGLKESYFGDQGAQQFIDAFVKQQQLEELYLDVNFNDMKDYGGEAITQSLLKLPNLKRLHLDLGQNEISYPGAMKVCESMEKLAQKLEKIRLNFLGTAINNRTKDLMLEKLGKYKNLEFYVNVVLSPEYLEEQAREEMKKEGVVFFNDTKTEEKQKVPAAPATKPEANTTKQIPTSGEQTQPKVQEKVPTQQPQADNKPKPEEQQQPKPTNPQENKPNPPKRPKINKDKNQKPADQQTE